LVEFADDLLGISQPFSFEVERLDIFKAEKFLVGTIRVKTVALLLNLSFLLALIF
jgi:hypothetical protein